MSKVILIVSNVAVYPYEMTSVSMNGQRCHGHLCACVCMANKIILKSGELFQYGKCYSYGFSPYEQLKSRQILICIKTRRMVNITQ